MEFMNSTKVKVEDMFVDVIARVSISQNKQLNLILF